MAASLSITISANADEQKELAEQVEAFLLTERVERGVINKLLLVLDDAITNIATHAYQADAVDRLVRLDLALTTEGVTLDIMDRGREFDPLTAPEPDVTLDLDERAIGGLGVLIVKRLMDRSRYERRG